MIAFLQYLLDHPVVCALVILAILLLPVLSMALSAKDGRKGEADDEPTVIYGQRVPRAFRGRRR